jgi:DNA ligase 1
MPDFNELVADPQMRRELGSISDMTTWRSDHDIARAPDLLGDVAAVEGVMLKRRDAPYVPDPPKGPWWKWKRDPFIIDAVLMYAQRGHGKRLPIRIGSRRKYRTAG